MSGRLGVGSVPGKSLVKSQQETEGHGVTRRREKIALIRGRGAQYKCGLKKGTVQAGSLAVAWGKGDVHI